MTYRARCAGHKRRTPRRPLPVPYVETLDVDPVGVAFMGGTVHGFTLTPINEVVTINGKAMRALGVEYALKGGGIMMWRGEVIDTTSLEKV